MPNDDKPVIDFTGLPDKKADPKKGIISTEDINFQGLPDPVQVPQNDINPVNQAGIADNHLDFLSFGIAPEDAAAQQEAISSRLQTDASAKQLKGAVKQRMIDVQRRRQPELRRAPEKTLWEEMDGYMRHIFGMKEAGIAEANIALEARERGLTVEEFKRQVVPEGEGLRRIERFFSGTGAGAVGTIEGMAGAVQWITDGELGQDLANQASIWRSEMVPSAEERNFSDDVASGVGSMAVFFLPGFSVASGTTLLFGASTRFAAWAGTGIMTAMEASTEAGMVYRDVIRETGSKTKAEAAATTTFWLNVPLITITNKLGFFTEGGSVLFRAARGGLLEGTQEAGQEVISGIATGDTPRMGDLARAFGVGAITGGGVGIIQSLSEDKTDTDITERDNEFIQSFQDSLKGITEEVEAIEVETGKPVAQEQFEEIIDTVINEQATEEEVVSQLLGELEVAVEGITEEDVPQKLADAIGKPNEPAVLERSGVVSDEAQIEQIVRDEIQSKLDTADAFEARGDIEEATRIREEARESGETLKEADGIVTEKAVDSVLGGEEVGKALTELELKRQEGKTTRLRERAEKIEVDAIATLTALTEEQDPLPQLENIGRIVFDEGATDIETFTKRMKVKLGNLWERFKGFMQTVFDKLKEETGAIEFGRDVPLFPELQLDENLKPVFDTDNRLASLKALVEEGGRVQQSIKELQNVRKQDIIKVIDKIQNNQALNNEIEKTTALAIAESLGNAFFAQVGQSKGDFFDATEGLAEGELLQITDKGIADFIAGIKFKKIEKPTKTQIQATQVKEQGETVKNLEREVVRLKGIAQRQSTQAFRQEERLEETTDILVAEIKEQVKLAVIARREGRQKALEAAGRRINRLRSREAQRRVKGRIERGTRRTLTELASETLPVALRGKFLKAIANATTPKQFGDVAIRIQSAANAFTEAQELKKTLGTKRGKIAYIRKINEINQTVINDIKKELGIDKPLRQMNEEELEAVTEKLKARVRFKRSRGFRPKIEARGSKRTDIPEALYEVNRNIRPTRIQAFKKKAKDLLSDPGKTTEKLLGVISTRLANVSESLRQTLRKFEFATVTQIQKDNRAVVPYIKKVQKLSKDDFADLDMALKNGDTTKINEITERNEFTEEYQAVKKVLDDIYARANEVGFDIGYLENYFPRKIEDSNGFLEFMQNREDWSILDEAIKRKELSLGRALVEQEKVNLINNMIRGYSGGSISLSATGNMKDRIIDFVTPEMNAFYSDSNSSLLDYIASVNEAVEARKLFGKSRPTDSKADEFNNMEDSLGFYILDLVNKGEITPAQEKEVRTVLTARFSQRGTTGWVGIYKNLSYLKVMGSIFNAVTQIGDLSLAIYAGGLRDFLPATARAIVGKSVIKKEDIGIEKIAAEVQEKSVMAGAVDTVFRLVGLTQIDTVGKEALINSVISKYQRQARQGNKGLEKDIKQIFGNSTEDVIQDLKDGFISEDVKYLAFNELLNFQPVVLSEVPEQYLRGGNGRIFYMLKTWQIKLFDIYRNEVYNQFKTDPVQATKNMIWLSILVMAMNGTADVLKDLLLGREVKLDDLLVDNAAKLIGFSRYSINQVRREGIGSAIGQSILPPFALVDDVTRDIFDLYKSFAENEEMDKLRTIENIPVIGKLYYYWFGRGSEIKKKQR